MAPECFGRSGYSGFTGDVYAFGITMGMLAGDIPRAEDVSTWARVAFDDSSPYQSRKSAILALQRPIMSRFEMPLELQVFEVVQRLVTLIFQSCHPDPAKRPSAARVVTKLGEMMSA